MAGLGLILPAPWKSRHHHLAAGKPTDNEEGKVKAVVVFSWLKEKGLAL